MLCGSAIGRGRFVCAGLAVVIACACRAQPGTLAYAAKKAKRQGKKATTITIRHALDESRRATPLDSVLRRYSTIVAVPANHPSVQTTDDYYLYMWYPFHIVRILAQPTVPPDSEPPLLPLGGCNVSWPRELPRRSNEIAIPLPAGITVIDGVAVTMDSDEWYANIRPGQQYLFLAMQCPGGPALLPQGRLDIFEVMTDGRIVPQMEPWYSITQEMLSLGTIDRLTQHIKALSTATP